MFDFLRKNKTIRKKTISSAHIIINGERLDFKIHTSYRRTISIQITRPLAEVIVKAPYGIEHNVVASFIKEKYGWICKKREEIKNINGKHITRMYNEGSVHLLLGKRYILSIENSKKREVYIDNDKIVIQIPDESECEYILRKWYINNVKNYLSPIINPWIEEFYLKYGVKPSKIEFKYAKSYWGNCSMKKVIRINAELMRAPTEAIEYIICHELCHLKQMNHSESFYSLLSSIMPDWKRRKKLLEETISCKD